MCVQHLGVYESCSLDVLENFSSDWYVHVRKDKKLPLLMGGEPWQQAMGAEIEK